VEEQILGVEGPCLLVGALGLGVEALLRVADAEVEVRLEVLRLEPDDLLQLGDGAAVVALIHQQRGELVAREGVRRVELDGGLQLGDGLLDPTVVGVGEAEVQVCVRVLRIELDRLLVGGDRELRAVGGEEAGEVVVRGGAVRLELERGEVLGERLAVELLLGVDGRQVVVGVGRVGVEVDRLAGTHGWPRPASRDLRARCHGSCARPRARCCPSRGPWGCQGTVFSGKPALQATLRAT
jgi:hypothetical protein